jgi:hypothetical protein
MPTPHGRGDWLCAALHHTRSLQVAPGVFEGVDCPVDLL